MTPLQEKWVIKYLLARLDQMWGWWPPRKAVKQRSLVMPQGGGRVKLKDALHRCEVCKLQVDKVQIDHKVAKGSAPQKLVDLVPYILRYLCSEDNLQALCLPCHKLKTKTDIKEIVIERARTKGQWKKL